MEVTSIRWPAGTRQQLMRLAHLESLRTGRQVCWTQLVRRTVEEHLLGKAEPVPPVGESGGPTPAAEA